MKVIFLIYMNTLHTILHNIHQLCSYVHTGQSWTANFWKALTVVRIIAFGESLLCARNFIHISAAHNKTAQDSSWHPWFTEEKATLGAAHWLLQGCTASKRRSRVWTVAEETGELRLSQSKLSNYALFHKSLLLYNRAGLGPKCHFLLFSCNRGHMAWCLDPEDLNSVSFTMTLWPWARPLAYMTPNFSIYNQNAYAIKPLLELKYSKKNSVSLWILISTSINLGKLYPKQHINSNHKSSFLTMSSHVFQHVQASTYILFPSNLHN